MRALQWGGIAAGLAAAIAIYGYRSLSEPPSFAPAAPLTAEAVGLPAYLDCLQEEGVALVSAHRGGPKPGFPENAIETFAEVLRTGPALLEVDVRTTADGVLMLLHDRMLERTTTCEGRLSDTTARAVRSCRLKDNDGQATEFRIPTLAQTLEWSRDKTIVQLDIKERESFPEVVNLVAQADAFDRVIFITYSQDAALEIADLHPQAVISVGLQDAEDLTDLEEGGLPLDRMLVWLGFGQEKPSLVAALDAQGVMSSFGTLGFGDSIDDQIAESGDVDRYRRIANTGVDVIASDAPYTVIEALVDRDDPADELLQCASSG